MTGLFLFHSLQRRNVKFSTIFIYFTSGLIKVLGTISWSSLDIMLLQLVQVSISSILILKKMNQYKQQRGQDVTVVTTQQGKFAPSTTHSSPNC